MHLNDLEVKALERFLDRWSPETKGESFFDRIDRIDNKWSDLMLGVTMLSDKFRYQFPERLKG